MENGEKHPSENKTIGVYAGDGRVVSHCCFEGRHAECMGMTENTLRIDLRFYCMCECHGELNSLDKIFGRTDPQK